MPRITAHTKSDRKTDRIAASASAVGSACGRVRRSRKSTRGASQSNSRCSAKPWAGGRGRARAGEIVRASSLRRRPRSGRARCVAPVRATSAPQGDARRGGRVLVAIAPRGGAHGAVAPPAAHSVLDEVAGRMETGGDIPEELRHSVTITIPKEEVFEAAEVARCSAESIRQMALMQRGSKISALKTNTYVAPAAVETVASPHKDVLMGHRKDNRIAGFDSTCGSGSLLVGRDVGGVLRDFAKTFPHLLHGWLSKVLERMRLPGRFVKLIVAMYRQSVTTFEVTGPPVAEVQVASGIRQGCPLSGSPFALARFSVIRTLWRWAHVSRLAACPCLEVRPPPVVVCRRGGGQCVLVRREWLAWGAGCTCCALPRGDRRHGRPRVAVARCRGEARGSGAWRASSESRPNMGTQGPHSSGMGPLCEDVNEHNIVSAGTARTCLSSPDIRSVGISGSRFGKIVQIRFEELREVVCAPAAGPAVVVGARPPDLPG